MIIFLLNAILNEPYDNYRLNQWIIKRTII